MLDAALRKHHWNFATGRASLTPSATPPAFGWSTQYPLPDDWLKIREFNGMAVNTEGMTLWEGQMISAYVIEGRFLLTNYSQAFIVYTRRVTNPTLWDSLFYQFMQTLMASELASAIPKDTKKSSDLLEQAMMVWYPAALAADGQEGTVFPTTSDSLTWGR
jgi:glutathionyl-hydroquinone reductase